MILPEKHVFPIFGGGGGTAEGQMSPASRIHACGIGLFISDLNTYADFDVLQHSITIG